MRTLDRQNMTRLMKEVCDKLDANEIKNEIPFVYKNKNVFEHIKILVPSNIDASILGTILDSVEYQDSSKFIDFYYKGFRFIFIRVPDEEFFQQFFYYSWDILSILMNVILNQFGMNLYPHGLRFVNNDKNIFLTNNMKYVVEFLEMNFDIYKKGFFDFFSEVTYILTSPYYDNKIFQDYELPKDNFLYFDLKPQLDKAKEILYPFKAEYDFSRTGEDFLMKVDMMFEGSNFMLNMMKSLKDSDFKK